MRKNNYGLGCEAAGSGDPPETDVKHTKVHESNSSSRGSGRPSTGERNEKR